MDIDKPSDVNIPLVDKITVKDNDRAATTSQTDVAVTEALLVPGPREISKHRVVSKRFIIYGFVVCVIIAVAVTVAISKGKPSDTKKIPEDDTNSTTPTEAQSENSVNNTTLIKISDGHTANETTAKTTVASVESAVEGAASESQTTAAPPPSAVSQQSTTTNAIDGNSEITNKVSAPISTTTNTTTTNTTTNTTTEVILTANSTAAPVTLATINATVSAITKTLLKNQQNAANATVTPTDIQDIANAPVTTAKATGKDAAESTLTQPPSSVSQKTQQRLRRSNRLLEMEVTRYLAKPMIIV